jgi:hypothetical protein
MNNLSTQCQHLRQARARLRRHIPSEVRNKQSSSIQSDLNCRLLG